MTKDLNPTEKLFSDFGMHSVSRIKSSANFSTDIPLSGVRVRDVDLLWVARIITRQFNNSGMFSDHLFSADEVVQHIREFYQQYLPGTPSNMSEKLGSTSNGGLLTEWLLLKHVRPQCYLESGVFIGASLRLADMALPEARKWAYDLSFKPLLYKADAISYVQNDIEKEPPSLPKGKSAFAFFDDHIDPVRRILLCHQLGVEWVLFDDSPVFGNLNRYRYPAVPSISMILDEDMPDDAVVEWKYGTETQALVYRHDKAYCEKARKLIVAHIDMQEDMQRVGVKCGDKVAVRLRRTWD